MMAVSIQTHPVFRAGKPIQLFEARFAGVLYHSAEYDVAPDGQHFVMIQDVESWSTQIHVVQNWFEELKQRVPLPKR